MLKHRGPAGKATRPALQVAFSTPHMLVTVPVDYASTTTCLAQILEPLTFIPVHATAVQKLECLLSPVVLETIMHAQKSFFRVISHSR